MWQSKKSSFENAQKFSPYYLFLVPAFQSLEEIEVLRGVTTKRVNFEIRVIFQTYLLSVTRWVDDIVMVAGKQWTRLAGNRGGRRAMAEAYAGRYLKPYPSRTSWDSLVYL